MVGLVSWGFGCGLGLPSVYANLGVSRKDLLAMLPLSILLAPSQPRELQACSPQERISVPAQSGVQMPNTSKTHHSAAPFLLSQPATNNACGMQAFLNTTIFDNYLSYVMGKIPNSLNGTATTGGPAPASSVSALPAALNVTVRSAEVVSSG